MGTSGAHSSVFIVNTYVAFGLPLQIPFYQFSRSLTRSKQIYSGSHLADVYIQRQYFFFLSPVLALW